MEKNQKVKKDQPTFHHPLHECLMPFPGRFSLFIGSLAYSYFNRLRIKGPAFLRPFSRIFFDPPERMTLYLPADFSPELNFDKDGYLLDDEGAKIESWLLPNPAGMQSYLVNDVRLNKGEIVPIFQWSHLTG